MSLALFILGIFGLLVALVQNLSTKIKQSVEVQVFLQKNVSESQIISLRNTLSTMDFVAKDQEKAQITFISKKGAAETFSKEIGEDFVRYIGDNPLSDLLIIRIDEAHQSPTQLRSIKAKIESLKNVLEATYVEKVVESIYKNLGEISTVLLFLMLILFTAVVIIIYNAIRLAVFSQRFLIRSMQLVGATDSFIQRPFLLRTVFYAFLSAEIACTALYALIYFAERQIPQLELLKNQQQLLLLALTLFAIGMMTSYFSTRGAISKYLRLSLDELH